MNDYDYFNDIIVNVMVHKIMDVFEPSYDYHGKAMEISWEFILKVEVSLIKENEAFVGITGYLSCS